MKKIPTLFVRNPDDRKHVLPEVTPGCEWVLAGEGTATRKFDGTACMFDGERWWARREVKPGRDVPDGWQQADFDPETGKAVGWQPAERSGFAKFIAEAVEYGWMLGPFTPGTYELLGPKIQGNPEGAQRHMLVPHGYLSAVERDEFATTPRDFAGLGTWLLGHDYEGIVWHHPDGRMAKLKKRDFA